MTDAATLAVEGPVEVLPDLAADPPPRRPRIPVLQGRSIGPLPLVGLCILLAHLPYLLGIFDPNPLLQQSALGEQAARGLLDLVLEGERGEFEGLRVRHRGLGAAHALDRRIEIVEALA